jgi:hypothetical protein
MTWIPDVITRTTILSTWGNTVRNHVVHTFANTAERNAAAPTVGMFAYQTDTGRTMRWDGTGWVIVEEPWQSFSIRIIAGRVSWQIGAVGTGVVLRLSPQSMSRYRRHGPQMEMNIDVVFQDPYPPGEPPSTVVAELPLVADQGAMDRIIVGAAGSYSNAGARWFTGGVQAQGSAATNLGGNITSTSPAYPVAADTWGAQLSYPIALQYAP